MEKILNYLKNNYKNLLFCTILIILNIYALNHLFDIYTIDKKFDNYYLILILTVLLECLLFLIIKITYKKNMRLENIFLILIVPIGLLYLILIPIGRVPDERNHFARAYEISEGHLISDKNEEGTGGQNLPIDVENIFKSSKDKLNYNDILHNIDKSPSQERKFITFSNMSLYSFVCYIPQVIGISIGRFLSLPIVLVAYLGRLTNFIVCITLIYFAIKLIPYKKMSILLFAFMPMMLQEMASLSADALTNGMAFFLISYTLYVKNKKSKVSKKDFIVLTISSIVMSLCKIIYLPLCLILLLIPYDKFKTKRDKYIKIGLLALFVVLINLVWLKISSSFLGEIREGVDPSSQVYYILHNPLIYIQTFYDTIYENLTLYLFNIVGFSLCYFDVNPSYIYVLLYLFLIIYSLIVDSSNKVDNKDKLLNVIIILSTIVLMYTSLYIQWTPLGLDFIDGVQGRYFIPLLIPIALLFNNNLVKINMKKSNLELYICNFIIFLNIYVLMLLFFYHVS